MSGGPRSRRRTHRSTIHRLILSLMCLVHITGCPYTVRVSFSLACHSQRYRWFDLLNGRSKDTDYCKYSSIVRAPLSVLSTLKSHLRETLQSFHPSFRLSVYDEVTAEPVVRSSWSSYVQLPSIATAKVLAKVCCMRRFVFYLRFKTTTVYLKIVVVVL